jgi:mannose-1-phosphate guanylyltransferase
LALADDTGRSLIAATLERLTPLLPLDHIYIATGASLVQATRAELPSLPESAFLAEPAARNTAPCIGWATRVIARRDPDATVLVIPSDQHVERPRDFGQAVAHALESANGGAITTIGIEPTRPETGYGYIEVGDPVSKHASRVARFVEKPNRTLAETYLASGRFLWNSGMFFYRASVMTRAIAQHLPELAAGLDTIDEAASRGSDAERETLARVFPTLPSISIDCGVIEREASLHVVRADFGWSDLGSFASVWEHRHKDERENAVPPGSLLVDAERNLVYSADAGQERRVVALLGVQDLCVVMTDDAVLVMPRDRAQDVRAIVDQLKSSGRHDLL